MTLTRRLAVVALLSHLACAGQPEAASEEDLRRESVPNTILFPDEHGLGLPPCPPQLPWACFQWYDPLIGPRCPEEGVDFVT